jgi:hypothetical protein
MFTKIQMYNDKALGTRAALKKLILERPPLIFLEQMHTVDLTGKSDYEISTIITSAGCMAEGWDAAWMNLGLNVFPRSQQQYKKSDRRSSHKDKRQASRKD